MASTTFHTKRLVASFTYELVSTGLASVLSATQSVKSRLSKAKKLTEAEALFDPERLENPYPHYKQLRDENPVYKPPGQDYYVISRYEDIVAVAKNTQQASSKIVQIIAGGKPKHPNKKGLTLIEHLGEIGIIPVDVLATQDPPIHKNERKIAHGGFNARFIQSLAPEIEAFSGAMLDDLIKQGSCEFVHEFAWQMPMKFIIGFLGYNPNDYPRIKNWCATGIKTLSGSASKSELILAGAETAQFFRYLWEGYNAMKANLDAIPDTCFTKTLALQADDPESIMTDQRAISTIFQLLIAGSDSSASTMGACVKKLAECPEIANHLRTEPDLIDGFIEEIFRTESAFQGHFRYLKSPMTLHGVALPINTRLFLSWGSGNRDERFWENPDKFIIGRQHGKKHLTFGHGVHACLGRELARMEIRIAITQLLEKTQHIEIIGDTPYEASLFARSLQALPLGFTPAK